MLKKEDLNIKIAERIIHYRKGLNLSQEDLGDLLDVSKQNIQMIESGKRNPGTFLLKKIAKALGVSLSKLLEGI
ncbi:helix-turn-helix transcriptional regulator [Flavobacteriales bacterium]|nr:helix-turn-helix transcriptional regulator [Flavobacteriales bacterium]MDB2317184.1 helix-turn-helix transcriptional regulator [Flavobacteriales bacterium]MDB2621897.1 helix-turn-helix transcriptional regulator [Flavobacteriales bacterium]MDG1850315.1 helix-turn-helix transcriptional regulator [Flavobacteriales bacterium]